MRIGESSYGVVEFEGNELYVTSTNHDPSKVRVGAPIEADGGGGGAISFDATAPGQPRQEMVLFQGKQSERVRGHVGNYTGCVTLHLRDDSVADKDAAMVKVLDGGHDYLWLHPVWVESLRRILGSGPVDAPTGRPPFKMLSENGRFELILQNEGPFAIYDYSRPDGDRLVWASTNCVMRK